MKSFLQSSGLGDNFLINKTKRLAAITFFFLLLVLSNHPVKAQTAPMCKLSVQLLLNTNGGSHNTADGLSVYFSSRFPATIGNEDSYKMTNLDENMAINRNGVLLSMEGRPDIADADTVPLKMWQFRQNNYCLSFKPTSFPTGLSAVLKDSYLNVDYTIKLTDTTIIPFNLDNDAASSAPDRFCIVFKSATTLSSAFTGISAQHTNEGVMVNWTSLNETNVAKYEVEKSSDGYQFSVISALSPAINASSTFRYTYVDNSANAGNNFYRIKMTEQSGKVIFSPVVKVKLTTANNHLSIYPNPVKGGTINIKLTNLEKGIYAAVLTNTSGQIIHSAFISNEGGIVTKILPVKQSLQKGLYILQLKKDAVSMTETVVVE